MGLIYIKNGNICAGILTDVGGRIVSLQRDGGSNILESNPNLWNEDETQRITPSPRLTEEEDFKAYNGHEVWVGPQSEWWKQQTLNVEKSRSALFWPPDPYIIYDCYTVLEKTGHSIVMQGTESPISGVQLIKKIAIDENGKLHFEVTARNIRSEAVKWDLWLITRVNGYNLNFVPVTSSEDVCLTNPSHAHQGKAPYKVENGFFSFTAEKMDSNYRECTGKAVINPAKPYMATLAGDNLLVIRFDKQNPADIHPEQGEVELYSFATPRRETSLLELEIHAPYKTLQPGESMSTRETWEVYPFPANATEEAVRRFLEEKYKN
jgi:hypothetical protein